jgi:hypothetical protein
VRETGEQPGAAVNAAATRPAIVNTAQFVDASTQCSSTNVHD